MQATGFNVDCYCDRIDVAKLKSICPNLVEDRREICNLLKNCPEDCGMLVTIDCKEVLRKLAAWKYFLPNVRPYYAVKCNPDRVMTWLLMQTGDCCFDCASTGEMELLFELGLPIEDRQNHIIFAHPSKSPESIVFALTHNINLATFDAIEELSKIHNVLISCFPSSPPVVRLLLRFMLPSSSASLVHLSDKFGHDITSGVDVMIEKCKEYGFSLEGMAFHVGSGCFDYSQFVAHLQAAIHARIGNIIDLGGGFPCDDGTEVNHHPLLNLRVLARDYLSPILSSSCNCVMAEPGRYFSQRAVSIYCKVYSISSSTLSLSSFNHHPMDSIQVNTLAITALIFVDIGPYALRNSILRDALISGVTFRVSPHLLIPDDDDDVDDIMSSLSPRDDKSSGFYQQSEIKYNYLVCTSSDRQITPIGLMVRSKPIQASYLDTTINKNVWVKIEEAGAYTTSMTNSNDQVKIIYTFI